MKSFISAFVASTLLASTAFASLKSCGSPTNDLKYESVEYSPYPAIPTTRVCFNIRGKIQATIPLDANATIRFYQGSDDVTYSQEFRETLEPRMNEDIPKGSTDHLETCYYFPTAFQYKKDVEVRIKLDVTHPRVSDSNPKRILCLQGTIKI
ncbi:hypothetical protein BGZ81_004155 [Podila clonocystis]|nr:hypothetical protein BGZ81_004155 [Podila clonocystis]